MDVSVVTKKRIEELAELGRRLDGRKLIETRELTVEQGVLKKAEGSARVKFGDSEVLVGIKFGLGVPYTDSPEGVNWDRSPGLDRVRLHRPAEVVDQTAMQDHRSLGLAGRARRVHYVGQVRGNRARLWVAGGFLRDDQPVGIETNRLVAGRGVQALARCIRQQHPDS